MLSTMMAAGLLAAAGQGQAAAAHAAPDAQVIELRQYRIVPGQRDAFVALFERLFVESQEALGMRLVGQYRDLDDPDRFVWIRGFADMAARERGLNAFYFGPVWQAHRNGANPLLDDNDNVLLLRPAAADLGFAAAPRTEGRPGGTLLATIIYLWKPPGEGFTAFFEGEMRPAIEAAGLPLLGGYVPEEAENNFPRLPVRSEPRLFVWFTRAADAEALADAIVRLHRSARWRERVAPRLARFSERPAQTLRLAPTPRSALR
jgi:quinol monooxygenase YgiN